MMFHSTAHPPALLRLDIRRLVAIVFTLVLVAIPAATMTAAPARAEANSIQSIDIDVRVQPDGSAMVTENRAFTAHEGTEHYLPFENLGESEIRDFYVTENGQRLTEQSPWDVDGSIEEKAGKYGINKIKDGVELCFGIGQLGSREFTIYYTITNFVRLLEDGNQAIYWQFLHSGMDKTDQISINVHGPEGFEFVYPDTKLWGFGFDGDTEIQPQTLHMSSTSFTQSSRAVMLAILPPSTVTTAASYPYDSAGIEAKAKEGSVWESGPARRLLDNAPSIIGALVVLFAFVSVVRKANRRRNQPPQAHGFAPTTPHIEHTTQMPPHDPFALAALYPHSPDSLVKACLIKWILEGVFVPEDYESGILVWRENRTGLRLAGTPNVMSPQEERLFAGFRAATGPDGLLKQQEITRHFAERPKAFRTWRGNVRRASQQFLLDHGLIREVTKGTVFRRREFEVTPQGQELVDHLEGFKNYLRDGWYPEAAPEPEKHLVWAAFLDALDRAKDRLGPAFVYATQVDIADLLARCARAGYAATSSSRGGGGRSSSGGGRGASGASSGGGTR